MTITVTRLKRAVEELRDDLTNEIMDGKTTGVLVDPFALDILANRPTMLTRLAEKLSERS